MTSLDLVEWPLWVGRAHLTGREFSAGKSVRLAYRRLQQESKSRECGGQETAPHEDHRRSVLRVGIGVRIDLEPLATWLSVVGPSPYLMRCPTVSAVSPTVDFDEGTSSIRVHGDLLVDSNRTPGIAS